MFRLTNRTTLRLSTPRASSGPTEVVPSSTAEVDEDILKYCVPLAEKAKAILFSRISGTFTSLSFKVQGTPLYGSTVAYVLHERWYCHPIVALRTDEKHYDHVKETPKASLLVNPLTPKHISPKSVPIPRINFTGDVKEIESEEDRQVVRSAYERAHRGAKEIFDKNPDAFKFFELQVLDVHFMKGSGQMEPISFDVFKHQKEDPIAPHSRKFIEDVNNTHSGALRALCKEYGDIETSEAFIYGIDRLGFDVLGKIVDSDEWVEFRMPWERSITNLEDLEATFKQILTSTQKE